LPGSDAIFASPAIGPDSRRATEALDRIAALMEKRAPVAEIRSALLDTSKLIDAGLDDVAKRGFDARTIEGLIERINDQKAWARVASWDEAAQRYLSLVPLSQSFHALEPTRAQAHDALHQQLLQLLDRLSFPNGYDSPRGFEFGRFPIKGR
jgi:hypothetical protein